MKYLIITLFALFAFNMPVAMDGEYFINGIPVEGSTEVVSETEGKEFSFPVLETPYNLANPPTYKFFYFGKETSGQEEAKEIAIENVSQTFVGIDDFLTEEGFKDLEDLKSKGLNLYFIKEKSNNGNNGKR